MVSNDGADRASASPPRRGGSGRSSQARTGGTSIASRSLETAEQRSVYYRRVCGLPTRVDPELGRISFPAGSVSAVVMPAGLGMAVRHQMQVREYAEGPVLTHPRSGTLTFLIRPDLPDDPRLHADLFRHRVTILRTGGLIALPSPVDLPAGHRSWIEPPRDTFRPLGSVVLASVRASIELRSPAARSRSCAS